MKKFVYILSAVLIVLIVFNIKLSFKRHQLPAASLQNIETLSYAETSSARCYGIGSVDCPADKIKVVIVYQ